MKMNVYNNHNMNINLLESTAFFLCSNIAFMKQPSGLSFDFSCRAVHTHSFIPLLFSIYHVSRNVMDSWDTKMDHALRHLTAMLRERMREGERERKVN